jgi:hypothetical protein
MCRTGAVVGHFGGVAVVIYDGGRRVGCQSAPFRSGRLWRPDYFALS